METYNPFACGDLAKADFQDKGPAVWQIAVTESDRRNRVLRWLYTHGYCWGCFDRGDGLMIEGWKYVD